MSFLKKDWFYKILAVFLATTLWLYVVTDQNLPIDRMKTIDIVYENLDNSLVLTEKMSTVNVKIKGDAKIINNLSLHDLFARVDLSGASLGEGVFPVQVSSQMGLEILDVFPKEVKLKIDRLSQKSVPVKIALMGETEHGYSSFKATVKPSHVVLKGAEEHLKNIKEARVEVNLEGAKQNLEVKLPLKILDDKGNTYSQENIVLSPQQVEVFVPIVKDTPSKTVPIRANIKGSPAGNYQIVRTLVEPETVKILGQLDSIDKINYLQTEAISVDNLTNNATREVSLLLPEGISTPELNKVKVIIQVEEGPKIVSLERKINISNKSEEKEVKIKPALAYINLEASKDLLEKLTLKNVQLFVDVKDLENGTHSLEVNGSVPNGVQIIKIDPVKVQVEISDATAKPQSVEKEDK